MPSAGAWGWGHTQGYRGQRPSPRGTRLGAARAFLSRLRPGVAEAPRSPGCPRRRLHSASGPVGSPSPLTEPCPPEGLGAPRTRPTSPPGAALPEPLRAPPSPAAARPFPARPAQVRGVPAHREPRGPQLPGVGPWPRGDTHTAACHSHRSRDWQRTQAPFGPALGLAFVTAPWAVTSLSWGIATTYCLPRELFPSKTGYAKGAVYHPGKMSVRVLQSWPKVPQPDQVYLGFMPRFENQMTRSLPFRLQNFQRCLSFWPSRQGVPRSSFGALSEREPGEIDPAYNPIREKTPVWPHGHVEI